MAQKLSNIVPERSLRDDTAWFYVFRESDTPSVDIKTQTWNYVAKVLRSHGVKGGSIKAWSTIHGVSLA